MNIAGFLNPGQYIHPVAGSRGATQINSGALSAGAGLIVTTTGLVVDRRALPRTFRAVTVVVPFEYGLASGKSWAIGGAIKSSSASGGTYAAVNTAPTAKTVSRIGSTATTAYGAVDTHKYTESLEGHKRFLRINVTRTGNATATGSLLTVGPALLLFGGPDRTPASSS